MIWLSFLLLATGIALLVGASKVAISNLVAISEKRRLRKSILSLLLVASSTSLPELAVAVNAIALGNMDVSLGDILGSNIANVAFIIGVSLIVASIDKSKTTKAALTEEDKNEFRTGLMWVSITLLLLLYLQTAGNIIGLLLLVLFFIHSFNLFRGRKEDEESNFEEPKDRRIVKEFTLTLAGILGVIAGARLAVESAVEIATFFRVPASIIGASLIAFGTSLPEFTVDIRAAYAGFMEIVMGDIVGSCFLNSTLILGILLLFTPSRANFVVLSDLILFSVTSNIVLWYLMETGNMGRRGGLILLMIYIINLLSLLGILVIRPL
ncbi:sodium:calcium antiporter [Candidatus Bathyarchaeota archaeon]|nr:sodium:calcium antiporter [Candidatus Bathyarchaeota archaeon]